MPSLGCTYDTLANVLIDEETHIPVPDHPYFVWVDENPSWQNDPVATKTTTPSVRVEIQQGDNWQPFVIDGVAEDDRGLDFVTTLVGSYGSHSRWNTIWMVPAGVDQAAVFRIVATGTSAREFTSEPFTVPGAKVRWGYVGFAR